MAIPAYFAGIAISFLRTSVCLAAIALLSNACSSVPTADERQLHAHDLAARQNWQPRLLDAGPFRLMSYSPRVLSVSETLAVYIEGDGWSWATTSRPSRDPTPRNPVALQLAMAHPEGNAVAYVARPCQFPAAHTSRCEERYWTTARFSIEVIDATNKALDILKHRTGAQRLTLVGYSGGAAVAALVALKRSDVELLVTVAGNLDHRAWVAFHNLSPLQDSLNPADFIGALADIRQIHLVGARDSIVPPHLTERFADRFPETKRPRVVRRPGQDHYCCWNKSWGATFLEVTRNLAGRSN